jgi:hypothetical protein
VFRLFSLETSLEYESTPRHLFIVRCMYEDCQRLHRLFRLQSYVHTHCEKACNRQRHLHQDLTPPRMQHTSSTQVCKVKLPSSTKRIPRRTTRHPLLAALHCTACPLSTSLSLSLGRLDAAQQSVTAVLMSGTLSKYLLHVHVHIAIFVPLPSAVRFLPLPDLATRTVLCGKQIEQN